MRAPTFDLTLLRTFVAVADTGSVTAAARRLAYTQSTVSMQLKRLEAQLETSLHERVGRKLQITADGGRLLTHARRLLAANDDAWQDMQARQVSGALRLGIPEDYALLLPAVLTYFHQLYPGVSLEVICGTSADLAARVKNDELELALVTRQRRSPGGEVIRREPLLWAVGLQHQPLLRDPLPLALYSRGADVFREVAEQALESAGRQWQVAYTSQSMSGLTPVVIAGLAIVVITRSMLTPMLKPLDETSGLPALPSIELALHWAPHRPSEPARKLGDLIRRQLAAPAPD